MVDTVRTLSELIALFPDNTSGAISEQDVRDFIVSAMQPTTLFDETGNDVAEASSTELGVSVKLTLNYELVLGNRFDVDIDSDGKVTGVPGSNIAMGTEAGVAPDDVLSIECVRQPLDGQLLYIRHRTEDGPITFKHADSGGTIGFRLFCTTGADIVLGDVGVAHALVLCVWSQFVGDGDGGWIVSLQ